MVVKLDAKFFESEPSHRRKQLDVNCGIVGWFWKLLESFTDSLFNKFVLNLFIRGEPYSPAKQDASKQAIFEI